MNDFFCSLFEFMEGFLSQDKAPTSVLAVPSMFTGKAYQRLGKVESGGEAMWAQTLAHSETEQPPLTEENIGGMRKGMEGFFVMMQGPAYDKYNKDVTIKKVALGGKKYWKGANRTYALIGSPKGRSNNGRCMLYFHGGGAVAGSPEHEQPVVNRYISMGNVNIINVKYGLAPENKAPRGIWDAYAATMNVVNDPAKFGCDANKIGIMGVSGGGYIAAGVGMMAAEQGTAHKIRFQIQQVPAVGNHFLRDPLPENLTPIEKNMAKGMSQMSALLSDGQEPAITNRWIFPNEMGDELASKVPPVIVQTSEFDFLRTMSREAKDLYKRNGTLIDFAEYGGAFHGSHFFWGMMKLNSNKAWYNDFVKIVDTYLN